MIETIDLGKLIIRYMPHWHISEKEAQWRARIIENAARVGSLGPWNSFWNTIYSAKIGACYECGNIYKQYANQNRIY